jgi:hypothetical protein
MTMRRLRIAPIVEGHGEDASLRMLLQRMGSELFDAYIEVSRPIRGKRMKLVQLGDLERYIGHAIRRLQKAKSEDAAVVLVLLDADNDLPCQLGPAILAMSRVARSAADIFCVIANVEYETWLVAGADSLGVYLNLSQDRELPSDPEERRLGKAWIQHRFRKKRSYSPTLDQPAMNSHMDLRGPRGRCSALVPDWDRYSVTSP